MASTKHDIFTALGRIGVVDGKKKFLSYSPQYVRSEMEKISVDMAVSMTISIGKSTRSRTQLAYHWVLIGYLAEYSGCTKEEMHDAILRIKFGCKSVTVGKDTTLVRRSVSDAAKMTKSDMIELISFDLEKCAELDIVVPTAEELGYISNTKSKIK